MQGPPPFGLNESDVQMAFSAKQGFNLPLKQTDALWELFLPKIGKFVKTAVLTLGMDILTILFLDGILMDIMIDSSEIWFKLSALAMVYIQ